jgi:hypothetical protein
MLPAGVTVAAGDVMTFTATGTYGNVANPGYSPASVGCAVVTSGGAFAPKLTAWSIVGQVGGSSEGGVPFCIGASAKVTADRAGALLLAINERLDDANMGHYVGFVSIKWSISRQP